MQQVPSITFLIGGKFSLPAAGEAFGHHDQQAEPQMPEEALRMGFGEGPIAALFWYMPLAPFPLVHNFYRFGSHHWGDLYGDNRFGVIGLDGERYFGWQHTAVPSYAHVRAAADELLDRCDRLRRDGTTSFRMVGHSAGCLVANVATHHAGFDIDQLILCAPPVPNAGGIPSGWSSVELAEAVPNVTRLSAGKFFYFHVAHDAVLALHGVDTTYDTPYIQQRFPDVVRAARTPGPIPSVDGDHWKPVEPNTWTNPPNLGGETYLGWIARQ